MKNLLKAAVVLAASMIVNIVINIICNMNGVELNTIVMSMTTTFVALMVYHTWIMNEKNKRED